MEIIDNCHMKPDDEINIYPTNSLIQKHFLILSTTNYSHFCFNKTANSISLTNSATLLDFVLISTDAY